ncbi:hypothetical protein V1477_013519 [Vespula maculifrons]|uniref:Uncharacterized protein n=1 Tax=Vespula maculifrons TaxID=7453 RepID=A0ABD2BQD8_VESMC
MLYRHSRLRETTTKSGLGPTFTVTSSVDFWTSTRELRQFSRMPSIELIQIYNSVFGCGLKWRVGIVGFGRRQQIRVLERPLLLLVQLCFGLRRENLEIFADAIHASINEQLIQIYDGIFGFRLKCRVEILAFERGRQSRVLDRPLLLLVQLCFGLRRENLDNFRGCHPYNVFGCVLKCRVGIVGLERRRQSRVLDRTLQLLVQLCFGLRRENIEIFADAIHASINKLLIQIYDGFFDFSIKYRVGIVGLERRQQSTNLEIFADAIHTRINEQLIQIYDGIFGFRFKCRLGILGFERRQQCTVLDRTLQLLVHLCFGLRRENLEIFADAIHASINEQLIQIYNSFFDVRLKYSVGKVGFGRRQQIRVLDRPFQLQLQLCFGLRRKNLEIFADAIHASTNE